MPRNKPRLLTDLQIDEVSSVSRGAGEGVRVMLMKRNDAKPTDFYKIFGARRPLSYSPDDIRKYRKANDDDARRFDTDNDTDTDLDTGSSPQGRFAQHLHEFANLIVEASGGKVTRPMALHYLINDRRGRTVATALLHKRRTEQRKESSMSTAERLARLDPVSVAKCIVDENKSFSITEEQLFGEIQKYASANRLPGESAAQAFSRVFSADNDEGLAFRKAVAVCKGATLEPLMVGGAAAQDVNDPKDALAQLNRLAEEQRRRSPELTLAQSFARVYSERPDLASAERRQAVAKFSTRA